MKKLFDSTLVIAIFSAILYCAYSRYYIGYCDELGVNFNLLDKNIHQVLFYGIHLVIIPFFNFISTGLVCLLLLYIFLKKIKKEKGDNFNEIKLFKCITISKIYNYLNDFVELRNLTRNFWFLCVAMIVFVYGTDHFQKLGYSQALVFIDKVKSSNFNNNKITVYVDGEKKELILIDCGYMKCVGYDLSDKQMIYFQSSTNFYTDVKKSIFSE